MPEEHPVRYNLSRRERQVAEVYAQGLSHKQIADRFCIAPATVRTHLGTIYRKLGVSTKIELLRTLEQDGGETFGVEQAEQANAARTARTTRQERRQVTVLSALPEGLGDLARSEDPEEVAARIGAFRKVVDDAIGRHRGRRLASQSVEILACFGLPVSDETDAERAVRCALEIGTQLSSGRGAEGHPLGARIGIFTGSIVVGSDADDLAGVAPHLAAALAREAKGGGIVVCARTHAALGGLFAFTNLGPIAIDSERESVLSFAVTESVPAETRFAALHGYQLTRFVGRESEIDLLESLFERTVGGEGQLALITGEPGIGKSRTVRMLMDRLAMAPGGTLLFQCSPHERSSPLHAVAQSLRDAAGVDRATTSAARLDALLALFGEAIDDPVRDRQVLADFASMRHEPSEYEEPPPPERIRAATLALLDRFLRTRATVAPQLVVFEDMHWADPTTTEWFDRVVDLAEGQRVLIVATARPEFNFTIAGRTHVTTLSLARLGRREINQIIADQAGDRALPATLMERIAERSDGIPLFAEELTRSILELGASDDDIPPTLQASLMGRLDRLGPAREVAQAAAAIGRNFDRSLLAEIVPHGPRDLDRAIDALVASKLVLRRGTAEAGALRFKHALIQDAAYGSLLRSRREDLHVRIADCLMTLHPETAVTQPELLAHHYTEAGLAEKAIPHWQRAGAHAAARSAHLEAIAHLSKGLELLATLPETRDRAEKELAMKIALGPAILATRGFGDPALAETYERACGLAEQLQDDTNHFTALWGLWIYHLASERFKTAEALSTQLLSVAGRHRDSAIRLQAHHAAWTTGFFRGELASCLVHTEKGESCYDRQRHRTHKFLYGGHDPAVCSLTFRSFAEWLTGFPDRALASSQRAVDLAIEIGHPNSHVQALTTQVIVHYFRGEEEAACEMGEAAVALCVEHGLGMWAPLLREVSQAALASCDGGEHSLDATRESIAALQQTGVGIFGPFRLATFVDALRRTGQSGAAAESLGLLDAAQSIIERKGEIWFQTEIHRLRGAVLLDGPTTARQEGEAAFRRAIGTARAQGARSLELRAATSLARHWVNNDNRTEAHNLLAPVYGWFTEGFDTADLKDAKALLDELG